MSDDKEPTKVLESQTIEAVDNREPWERLKTESDKAWRAFVRFRDSETRSLTAIAQSSDFKCSVANISRWAFVHRWRERTFAFDCHKDELERQEAVRGRAAMRRRHLQLGILMQSIGAHALAELQRKIEQKLPLGLSSDDARTLIDAGAKLEHSVTPLERDSRYTKIVVNLGTLEDDPEPEPVPPDKKLLN